MIQRFFFDGINLNGCRRSVAEAVKFSAAMDADEAESRLAFADAAVARAKVAVDFAGNVGFPPARFVKRFGGLENFKFWHGF